MNNGVVAAAVQVIGVGSLATGAAQLTANGKNFGTDEAV